MNSNRVVVVLGLLSIVMVAPGCPAPGGSSSSSSSSSSGGAGSSGGGASSSATSMQAPSSSNPGTSAPSPSSAGTSGPAATSGVTSGPGASSAAPSSSVGLASSAAGSSSSVPSSSSTGGSSSGQLVPLVGDAFGCANLLSSGGPGQAGDLQRVFVDTNTFPDALCNDGSPAAFNFRPATNPANANRWIIYLNGGGSCGTDVSCANRWCGLDPQGAPQAFDADNMSSITARGVNPGGLLDDSVAANDLATWNTVKIRYCSSDMWAGTARDVIAHAPDPLNPSGPVMPYRIHFLGRRILDAVMAIVRKDGVPGVTYTIGGGSIPLPDLDDADVVMVAGTSGGGAGVIHNLDHLRDELRLHNTACGVPGACPLKVSGMIWDIAQPSLVDLDYSTTTVCTVDALCTYEDVMTQAFAPSDVAHGALLDQTCLDTYAATGETWRCSDERWVMRNHITTPFFVRATLADGLATSIWLSPPLGLLPNVVAYARKLSTELVAFSNLPATAVEGAQMAGPPGVFAPLCTQHENLESTPSVFQTSITKGGTAYTALQVWLNWASGNSPSVVVHEMGDTSFCP